MFFDIQTLEKRKIPFEEAFSPGTLDLPDESVRQVGDLRASGVAELIDPFGVREIRVRGDIRGEVEALCARCLTPVRAPISYHMDLFYRPMREIARDEEAAITQDETEVGFYE